MKNYLKLMRVHHYVKNLLVFAALVCSGQLFNVVKLLPALAAFVVFCLISSAVYIVNDILDLENDRNHPSKSSRPLASGAVSLKKAAVLAVILAAAAFSCCIAFLPGKAVLFPVIYLVLNLGYSFGLKKIPIVDIAILVSGFLIRILFGAAVTAITVSNWMYLTVIAVSFYFALGKRRNESKQISEGKTRQVLKSYPLSFLESNMGMCLTLANVFYALWSTDEKTKTMYGTGNLIFTVPIVMLITLKYSLDIEGESDGDPVEVLLHDPVLLVLCAVYLIAMFVILYGPVIFGK